MIGTNQWFIGLVERINYNSDDLPCGWRAQRRTKAYAINESRARELILKLYHRHQEQYQPRRNVSDDTVEILEISTLREFRKLKLQNMDFEQPDNL